MAKVLLLAILAWSGWSESSALQQPAPVPPRLVLAGPEEPGRRLVVRGRVEAAGLPVAHARVVAYQTDAHGAYTREKPMDERNARLRGTIVTDGEGRFELYTIQPGKYPSSVQLGGTLRYIPAHIHLDVQAEGFAERNLQAVFADDALLIEPYWRVWVRDLDQPVLVPVDQGSVRYTELVIELHSEGKR